MKTLITVVMVLFAVGCRESATSDESARFIRPAALDAAHAAYLQGDFLQMTQRIRNVLLDPTSDALVRENALDLLEKAYEEEDGQLPAELSLPRGFEKLRYAQFRTAVNGRVISTVALMGTVEDASRIASVEVRRAPDEIVLQRGRPDQKWKAERGEHGTYISLETAPLDAFPEPGVMTLRMTFTDGTAYDAWFIADRLTASATPSLLTPSEGEVIQGPKPTLRWAPYQSPEWKGFEKRYVSIWTARTTSSGGNDSSWSFSQRAEDKAEATPDVALRGGDYWAVLAFDEERHFGALGLLRTARRAHAFHVAE